VSTRRTIGVAVAIPEPWGSELRAWRDRFGDPMARAVPTHVTLLPPTEVAADALDGIEEHLSRVARDAGPFRMLLRGTGSFRPVSPVVFVQVAEGISACELLERDVRSGPLWRALRFPYHPHVTVAHHLDEAALDSASADLADYEARFDVTGFCLYAHGPDGVWRPQRDYAFGGPLPQPPPV
jgi:2'-5' RNA ligase